MDKEGGNKEKMRKCRKWIFLHFFILSPFPHFLFISSFCLHFLAARLPKFLQHWLSFIHQLSILCTCLYPPITNYHLYLLFLLLLIEWHCHFLYFTCFLEYSDGIHKIKVKAPKALVSYVGKTLKLWRLRIVLGTSCLLRPLERVN